MSEYVRMRKATMDSIAQAIQEKDGSTDKISGAEMPARIDAISGGVNYLDYAQQCVFTSLNIFGEKRVEINLPNARTMNGMFKPSYDSYEEYQAAANTTVEELIIHCPNPITGIQQIFSLHNHMLDYKLKKLTFDVDFSKITHIGYAFKNLYALEIIDGNPIHLGSLIGNAADFLNGCPKLKTIRFAGLLQQNLYIGKSCMELSKESFNSLISCLSDAVTGKTLTLPLAAVNTAFETSEGAADGSTSAEWLALVAEHSNWTISLV